MPGIIHVAETGVCFSAEWVIQDLLPLRHGGPNDGLE
jgi:hypothetical protein